MYSVIQEAWNIQACKCLAIDVHGTCGDIDSAQKVLESSSDATHE